MLIHDHPIEVGQLVSATIGALCAFGLLYRADQARRVYRKRGENDPDVMATAASNIRDEGFRLSMHLLFVVIGIVTIVLESSNQVLNEREHIIRWILIIGSSLIMAQSFMVWRDDVRFARMPPRHDRRAGERTP